MTDHVPARTIEVIIVNFRTAHLVIDCLQSLEAERSSGQRISAIVIDNASRDGSALLLEVELKRRAWDWVTLLPLEHNGGFGAGNNAGIDLALRRDQPADYIWLLNPDTRVIPGAARALVSFLETHRSVGIAGTMLLEADGTPWPYAFRFPSILGELERGLRLAIASRLLSSRATLRRMGERSERVDWVSGASLALRRELPAAGLRFDESYFLYYDETDLCRQARDLGWETWYVPQALVLHIAGQSTGLTSKDAAERRVPAYWFESRQRYFRKNHGRAYAAIADLGWLAAHLLYLATRMIRRAGQQNPPGLVADFIRHCAFLPSRR